MHRGLATAIARQRAARSAFALTLALVATSFGCGALAARSLAADQASTYLVAAPSPAATDQPVTLFAAVGSSSASGTITFSSGGSAIGGCTNKPVSPANETATCTTSFRAADSPAQLSAAFFPAANSPVAGSTGVTTLVVNRAATSTSLALSSSAAMIGESVTYSAIVAPSTSSLLAPPGFVTPAGSVRFLDYGAPISSCASRPLFGTGGAFEATCPVTYTEVGTQSITAVYGGDRNFSGSRSAPLTVPIQVLGTINKSAVRWAFAPAGGETRVLALSVTGAPAGSKVVITCRGPGCPFARSTAVVRQFRRTVKLARRFAGRPLPQGVTIVLDLIRRGWIGRSYSFRMRPGRGPLVRSGCLAPGSAKPAACSAARPAMPRVGG